MSGDQLLGIAAIIGAIASPFSLYMIARLSAQLTRASTATLAMEEKGESDRTAILAEIEAVHAEVKPNNGLTNGETVDASLTKLIQMEERSDRSERDIHHMEAMSDIDPALAKKEAEEERDDGK